MEVERLGIDGSVSELFPPGTLRKALSSVPVEVTHVDGEDSLADCQAVVTLEYREAFLDLAWVHTILAGVDSFPHDRLQEAGTILTNSVGIHGDAVGETVAAYVLALSRRLHTHTS